MNKVQLPNVKFWEGKRVFVTGANGFKGRWLVQWLDTMGALVETNDSMDICDKDAISAVLDRFQPEIAILLAAVSTVQEAFVNPERTIMTNAVGTITLLEVLKKIPSMKAILNITTDKVYHVEGINRGYSETDSLGGLEVYAISKVCAEQISYVYQNTYNLPLATARAGNVIGGGDWKRSRLIPNYYFAQVDHTDLRVNNNAIRPWQYVLDCLCGYLLLCEKLYFNDAYKGAWNFASDEYESKSVRWVVDEMNKHFDSAVSYTLVEDRGYYETKVLKINSDKAMKVLKWIPKYSIEEAVDRTAWWYREFMRGQPMEYLHECEINAYME